MGTITGYTAERMKAIEDSSIVSGQIVGDNLILTRFNQTTVNAGNVRGAVGPTGPAGDVNIAQLNTAVPAGSIFMYPFVTVPTGWIAIEGQTISNASTLYPALWAVAPAAWKSGTSLILPDMRGRFPVGFTTADASYDELMKLGGSKNAVAVAHTHNIAAHTHALPNHEHTVGTHVALPHSHSFSGETSITTSGSELVTRQAQPINGGFATGRYMNPWNAAGANALLAGNTGFGTSYAYTGMSVGYEPSHTHTFVGSTGTHTDAAHIHTVTGGGSGTTQVITNQSGGTSTISQSPSNDGINANLPPYIAIRFIIRVY